MRAPHAASLSCSALTCSGSLSLFEIGARPNAARPPAPPPNTFTNSFDVANCIFDTRARPNEKRLLPSDSTLADTRLQRGGFQQGENWFDSVLLKNYLTWSSLRQNWIHYLCTGGFTRDCFFICRQENDKSTESICTKHDGEWNWGQRGADRLWKDRCVKHLSEISWFVLLT